jgi:hypothetical protein
MIALASRTPTSRNRPWRLKKISQRLLELNLPLLVVVVRVRVTAGQAEIVGL